MSDNNRRYDIDWLRVLATFTIFFFHCARFFDEENWHIKNERLDLGMSIFVGIVSQWIMPLFFVLSAKSAYYALSHRTDRQYLQERFKRLVIPLLFGIFVLIPPQVYIERLSHSQFSGSFIQFFPHYFDGFYAFGGNFAWMGLHLWYLEILFIFSLLTLPFFRYLRRETVGQKISQTANFFARPGVIFLLAIPLSSSELLVNLQPDGIGRRDFGGWSLLTYLLFFLLGYSLSCDERFQQSIERHRAFALVLGIITTNVGLSLQMSGYSTRGFLFALLRAFNSWFWLVAILGFGSKYLTFSNPLLRYANKAVLPFYILHQTAIVIIGFLIVSWDASVMVKYLVLSTSSFVVIVALYELVVKRFKVWRFLFGMKDT
ncbi:MAG: acyltransferase [Pleurocapsa sp. MO_226.B13]|nr:acyltransferase [Pleurocapsa sp. MO_226.B13]